MLAPTALVVRIELVCASLILNLMFLDMPAAKLGLFSLIFDSLVFAGLEETLLTLVPIRDGKPCYLQLFALGGEY